MGSPAPGTHRYLSGRLLRPRATSLDRPLLFVDAGDMPASIAEDSWSCI